MTDFHLEAEVRLIRWGESSSAGRTITLELHPDDGDGHPFKGFPTGQTHGQRFRVAFSAIGDDEQPVSACAPLRERPAAGVPSPPTGGGATSMPDVGEDSVLGDGAKSPDQPGCGPKERRHWYEMPPSQRAGMMCGARWFWIFLRNCKGVHVMDEDEVTNWLYQECGINSRAELKLDTNASPAMQAFQREQLRVFYAIESDYRKWAGLDREVR